MIDNQSVSIIGFGNIGRLLAIHLSKKVNIVVTDIIDRKEEAQEIGVRFVPIDEALSNHIIILAVPMEDFERTLRDIKDKLVPNSIVLDVCSLKVFSCELMELLLPKNIEVIGTHPLFGPQTAPDSLDGLKIALCDVRCNNEIFLKIKDFFKSLGLITIITTPENHDKEMASSQALTHFIGQIINNLEIKRVGMSTGTFDKLMDIAAIIKNDTPALFNNIQTMNPYARDIRNKFVKETILLNEKLNMIKAKNEHQN